MNQTTAAWTPSAEDIERNAYARGYKEAQSEVASKFVDARISLADSVAKVNNALAGCLDQLR